MNTPRWVQLWRERLDFLRSEEATAFDPAHKFKLRKDIEEAQAKLAEWAPPDAPSRPGPAPTHLRHCATRLFGRDDELAWLDRAWNGGVAKVASIVAWGGVGKTSLVAEWRNRLFVDGRAPEWMFDWSFYSQGVRERGAAPVDKFLRAALIYFGDPVMADSAVSGWEKGARVAQLVSQRRALLILDGLEPLQHAERSSVDPGGIKEPSIEALLKGLAARNGGLCVVTTRVKLAELDRFGPTLAPRLDLDTLTDTAGADLLASLLEPAVGRPVRSTPAEREEISSDMRGHALTLQLLGVYIQRALGDIRRWRDIDFSRANEEIGGRAFRVIEAYVTWLSSGGLRGQQQLASLRLLGFFDRPADPGCIEALLAPPAIIGITDPLVGLDTQGWALLMASLEEMRLVVRNQYDLQPVWGYDEAAAQRTGHQRQPTESPKEQLPPTPGPAEFLDAHPLVREFFAHELHRTNEAGWRDGHWRLYLHLCDSVPHWPEGIEGLAPLYQAVVHGCAAGRVHETCANVYRARILRGDRFYSTHQLGAASADLAALACFFERVWDTPSTELEDAVQAWLSHEAAFRLGAVGRLREALGPMRAGLERRIRSGAWRNAAISAFGLSGFELTLGFTGAAVEDAAKSVEYANRSEDGYVVVVSHAALADALHQAGDAANALALFMQAEAMQGVQEPAHPLLYSLQGYQYCDLILSVAERDAWHRAPVDSVRTDRYLRLCREVSNRATRSRTLAPGRFSLLSIVPGHLIHVILGRDPSGVWAVA